MEGTKEVVYVHHLPPNTKEQLAGLDEQARLIEESLQDMKRGIGTQGIPLSAESIRHGLSEVTI